MLLTRVNYSIKMSLFTLYKPRIFNLTFWHSSYIKSHAYKCLGKWLTWLNSDTHTISDSVMVLKKTIQSGCFTLAFPITTEALNKWKLLCPIIFEQLFSMGYEMERLNTLFCLTFWTCETALMHIDSDSCQLAVFSKFQCKF